MKLHSALCMALLLTCFSGITYSETFYFHNDHLGTPQALTDKDQNVVWQAEYDPFGKATETVATVEQNLRFPGQYLDRETGLHYNYFRTYDPAIGRYTQSDPIGLGGGINTYGYAYQNTIRYTDPTGKAVPIAIAACLANPACAATIAVGTSYSMCLFVGGCEIPDGLMNSEGQNEKRPKSCPSGTQDIDSAKKKYRWDKDKLHGIKGNAHGGLDNGKSWTGITPDGIVGINEDGKWSPQGHWTDLL